MSLEKGRIPQVNQAVCLSISFLRRIGKVRGPVFQLYSKKAAATGGKTDLIGRDGGRKIPDG